MASRIILSKVFQHLRLIAERAAQFPKARSKLSLVRIA